MRKTLLITVALTVLLSGCSWGIKLDHAGRQVHTNWNGDMSVCQRLGKVTVSVANRLGPLNRNNIKVRDELEVLARNEAGAMQGADTIQPLAEPRDGNQPWAVYQCSGATTITPGAGSSTSGNAQTFPVGSGS